MWGNYAAVPLKCSFMIKCFPLVQGSDETDVKPLQAHENSFPLASVRVVVRCRLYGGKS